MASVKNHNRINTDSSSNVASASGQYKSANAEGQSMSPMLQPSGAFAQPSFAQPSGAFTQPSGAFAQPSGAFAQPSGAFAQPSGAFAQPSFAQPSGAFAQDTADEGATIERFGKQEDEEISDKYDVGEQVGRGGCAVVLEAWRKTDRMHVVIKILQVSTGYDSNEAKVAVKRFYREAELIASLEDEHIVRCIDYGRYQGTPCMVLEFVEGLSLDKLLQNYGALPLTFATGIIQQLLGALAETHEKNIIHRDIKPGNIMVFDTPPPYVIRVLDFGISTVLDNLQSQTLMTQQGNVRGTPSYMAPELFTGDTRASAESDLYAVGLVYLECLTGEVAVNDKSFMRVAYKQVNEELDIPLFIPNGIADIIRKLCKKKKDDRYHSAQEVLQDIEANLQQAIKDEDKCLKVYQKNLKKNGGKKKTSNLNLYQTTAQKNFRTLFFVLIGIVLLIIAIIIVLMLASKDEPETDAQPNAPVEVVKTPEEIESERLEDIKQHTQTISGNVKVAWMYADMKVTSQNKEEFKKGQEQKTKKPSRSTSKRSSKNSGSKPVDPSSIVDIPF